MNEPTQASVALFQPNPQAVAAVTSDSAVARASQEVQAAMVIAKKFPRDEAASYNRIMRACKRPALAEVACYAYPRGGSTVTGPSIRMAECLAQNWGNIDFGVVELSQSNGESQVMAYAWDLETNTRQTKIFTVKHERRVGRGEKFAVVELTDPRDIYEMVANQGARRVRACILGVIPGDIVEASVLECEKTLKTGSTEPLQDRARKMVAAFSEMGVTQGMLETRIGHKIDAISEQEMVNLRRIYTSLKDGAAKREDFFTAETSKPIFEEGKKAPATPGKPAAPPADEPQIAPGQEKPVETPPASGLNVVKALQGLCKLSKVTEGEVVAYLQGLGTIEETLTSFADIQHVSPETLRLVNDQWGDIVKKLKGEPKEGLL